MSDRHLQRFHRWAMLWLQWFVSFIDYVTLSSPLSAQAHAAAHLWLDRIERVITDIILIRAAPYLRRMPKRKGVCEHRVRGHGMSRAVLGSGVWRAFRNKDVRQRIAALRQEIGGLVARVLRRLPRGLTRRRPILATWARRDAGPAATACSYAPLVADTS